VQSFAGAITLPVSPTACPTGRHNIVDVAATTMHAKPCWPSSYQRVGTASVEAKVSLLAAVLEVQTRDHHPFSTGRGPARGALLRQHVDGAALRHLPLGGRQMAIAQSSLTRSQRSRRRRDRGAAAHGRRQRMMQRSRLARQGLPGRRRRLRTAWSM